MFGFQLLHGLFTEHVAQGVLSGLMWSSAMIELAAYTWLSALQVGFASATLFSSGIPVKDYAITAILISLGRGLTWVAYGSLSYPLVIVFKSSKMLVVMVSASVILRKRFSAAQYLAALFVVSGLCLVSTAGIHGQSSENITRSPVFLSTVTGIIVAGTATVLEGIVSNLQERSLGREHRSLSEMLFITNGMGAILLFGVALCRGEVHALAASVRQDPATLLWLLATVTLAYGCGRRPAPLRGSWQRRD